MIKVLALIGAVLTCAGLALMFVGGDDQPEPTARPTSSASTPRESVAPTSESTTSSSTPSTTTTPSTTATSRSRSTTSSSTSSSADEGDGHDHGDGPEAAKQAAAADPARKVAARLVKELSRTDRSEAAWRRDVGRLMSGDGREQLAGMKPADVPFTKATGRARLVMTNQPSSVTQPIGVPTDEGMWLVMVTKEDGQWRAVSVSQFEGEGQ